MHHAIECQHFSPRYLHAGARKRAPMGQLLHLVQGAALLRLGQHELLLPADSAFWLPAEALAAFTPLAGCHYVRVRCSLRLPQPSQAGWLTPGPLLSSLLASLADWQRPREWQGPYGQRLQVIHDELLHHALQPQAHEELQLAWQALARGEEEAKAAWNRLGGALVDADALASQWQLVQALRLLKGGNKAATLAGKLGLTPAALDQASQRWLGCPLVDGQAG